MLSIFSCVCYPSMSSLEKCLFSSLAHFLIGSFIFLVLSFMSCLYIFEINSLLVSHCFLCDLGGKITFPSLKCSGSDAYIWEIEMLVQIHGNCHYNPSRKYLGHAWLSTNPIFDKSIVAIHKPHLKYWDLSGHYTSKETQTNRGTFTGRMVREGKRCEIMSYVENSYKLGKFCLATKDSKYILGWTSLMVQWLRIHLPMRGTWIWSLV